LYSSENIGQLELNITSSEGKKIVSQSQGNLIELERIINHKLQNLPVGLYIIQLQNQNQIYETKLIWFP